jgi:hypothetical protein
LHKKNAKKFSKQNLQLLNTTKVPQKHSLMKDENMWQLGIPTTSNFKHQPLAQAFCLWPSFGVYCKQRTTSSMRKKCFKQWINSDGDGPMGRNKSCALNLEILFEPKIL